MTLILEKTIFIGLVGLIADAHAQLIVAGVALLILIACLLYTGYRNKRYNDSQLKATENRINHQNAEFQRFFPGWISE